MRLAKHDQPRDGIIPSPHNSVLSELHAQGFRGFKAHAEREKALLFGPCARGIDTGSFDNMVCLAL